MDTGPPREILQGGKRLLWSPGDRLRLLSQIINFQNTFDRPCDEIRMKIHYIQTENFFGRLFSTRLVQSRPHHHLIENYLVLVMM